MSTDSSIIYLDHPLSAGNAPSWASGWGEDEYGPWVQFTVGAATQRMRWMLPDAFTMGTPEDEHGKQDWEFSSHRQTVSEGFWLFDTPVTQQLWEAVTDENHSHFNGAQRPVENVSWDDCQTFLAKLNDAFDGRLHLTLPSEVQWEYACRAQTETPIWNSSTQYDERQHDEFLDQIAWYSKNSDNKSHDVAQKDANPWGLYDMLGNVYEWCADEWRDRYDSESSSAERVVRGGGWDGSALYARAAFRIGFHPSARSFYLGFRCSSSGPGEEPERSGRSRRGAGEDSGVESDDQVI